jgi:hypothetical protein
MGDMGGDDEKTRQVSGLWRGQGPRGRRQGPCQGAGQRGALWTKRQYLMRRGSGKATRRRQMDKVNKGMVEGMVNSTSIPQSGRRSVSQVSQEVPRLRDRALMTRARNTRIGGVLCACPYTVTMSGPRSILRENSHVPVVIWLVKAMRVCNNSAVSSKSSWTRAETRRLIKQQTKLSGQTMGIQDSLYSSRLVPFLCDFERALSYLLSP